MAKQPLDSVSSGYASNQLINSNFQKISDAIDNTLSRTGQAPNFMTADIDMNTHQIKNLSAPVNQTDAVRLIDLQNYGGGGGGGSGALATNLLLADGSELVTFTQDGTDALSQSVEARLKKMVFLTDFTGGVADGSTVTDTAWLNALTQCGLTGQALYVPGGTSYYKVTTEINVPQGVKIWGDGYFSYVKQTVSGYNLFACNGDNEFVNLRMEGLHNHTDPVLFNKNNGIFASSVKNVVVRNCILYGWQSCGIQFRNVMSFNISENLIYGGWWNYYTGVTVTADISLYSDTDGNTGTISNNRCLSNNSQGIMINNQGYDHDLTVTGNICTTMKDDLTGEVALATLQRRHGIVAGYGGGGGQFTCTGNTTRNTLVSGIYHTANTTGTHAVAMNSNVCSLNGLVTAAASDSTLAGGISLNGGGAQSITVENNSIYDFRGKNADSVGSIMFNGNASANTEVQILNNVIDTSNTRGVLCKGELSNVVIRGNKIKGCIDEDIQIAPGASASLHVKIEDNTCNRTVNATAPSIYLNTSTSTKRNYIRRNTLIGFNSATAGTANSAISIFGTTPPFTIRDNYIENYQFGFLLNNSFVGRKVDEFQVDKNDFKTCVYGISFPGGDTTALTVCDDNTFSSVTTPFYGNGYYDAAYVGKRHSLGASTRVEIWSNGVIGGDPTNGVISITAGPKTNQGTLVVGDIIHFTAPVALGSPGWVCTTAGTPATPNVVSKMPNLI